MDEEFDLEDKREQKVKERALDESFKDAQINRGLAPPKKKMKKKSFEKTFPKLGFLLIALSIIGILILSNVPWAYIKYDTGLVENIEVYIDENFQEADISSQNLTNFSNIMSSTPPHYLGLTFNDFQEASSSTFLGFILLIIISVIITFFGIIDKIKDFSLEFFLSTHFIFGVLCIIPGMYIILGNIKLIGAHFLLHHNSPFITNVENIIIMIPAAFILTIFGFVIVKLAFNIMKMDLNELRKIIDVQTDDTSSERYPYGGVP